MLNHTTEREDVDAVLDFLERAEPPAGPAEPRYERHPDVAEGWLGRPESLAAAIRMQPLFASLDPGEVEHAASLASWGFGDPGEPLIAEGETERQFFVILEGTVDVFVEGEHVRSLRPGEFFGELAALDWGAGFGYSRLATVVAGSPLRLLVFPGGALPELVKRHPDVAQQIRAAVQERLPRHA